MATKSRKLRECRIFSDVKQGSRALLDSSPVFYVLSEERKVA